MHAAVNMRKYSNSSTLNTCSQNREHIDQAYVECTNIYIQHAFSYKIAVKQDLTATKGFGYC